MSWKYFKDELPPKGEKFLFHYNFGVGLANYGRQYRDINNNSEYSGECYHLVLWPEEVNSNNRYRDVMEMDENQMKELDMMWMPVPNPLISNDMKWISVKDRLPPLEHSVLCINRFGEMQVCTLEKKWEDMEPAWWFTASHTFIAKYWLPLPSPPKE